MTKDYEIYNMFDFISDESFKSWVLEPTADLNFFWQSWTDSHPEKAAEVAKAREFILSVKFQKQEDLSATKAAIYSSVMKKSRDAAMKHSSGQSSSSSGPFTIFKVAASIVLLLTLTLLLMYPSGKKKPQPEETAAIVYKKKMARRGEKLTLMLPDGSMVKLNAESSLKFPVSFGSQREVYLQGEAFFKVERDTLRPFIVKTGEVTTEVLGTSFNVNYSAGDSMVQVAVTSGKVSVTSGRIKEKFYLLPTEVLTCEKQEFTKRNFDEELLLGWKDDILAFENAGMDEIAKRLSAWYDVDFEIRGNAGVERKYSGKFKNRTLRHVLRGISYSSNFEFSLQQNKVIIELK